MGGIFNMHAEFWKNGYEYAGSTHICVICYALTNNVVLLFGANGRLAIAGVRPL